MNGKEWAKHTNNGTVAAKSSNRSTTLCLQPSPAPDQPATEAGSPFYRPVSVEEFLEQIHRDEHKRRMFAWKLATCLNISAPCAERAPNFRAALWRCVGGSRFHAA
jgi:hypothetical protein